MHRNPGQSVSYPLRWPRHLAERVTAAAKERTISVAAWLREAALEKLERQEKKESGT